MAHGIPCFIPAKAFCTRCLNYAQAIPGLDLQQVGVGVCSPQCCMLLPTLCQDFASGCQNSHHASHATFHLLQENGHLPGKAKVGSRTTRAMLRDSHESLAQGIPELWTFGLHEVRIDLRRLRGLRGKPDGSTQKIAPVPGPLHRASRPLPRNRMPRRIGSERWPKKKGSETLRSVRSSAWSTSMPPSSVATLERKLLFWPGRRAPSRHVTPLSLHRLPAVDGMKFRLLAAHAQSL